MCNRSIWAFVGLVALSTMASGALVIDYDFDTGHYDSTTVMDQAGGDNDATRSANGTTAVARFMRGDHAMDFDGTEGLLTTGSVNFGDGLSIAAWVRPDTLAGTQRIVTKDLNTSRPGGEILFDTSAGYLRLMINKPSFGGYKTTSPVLATGTWAHVVAVYDGTAAASDPDRMRLYVNGEQVPVAETYGSPPSGAIKDLDRDITVAEDTNPDTGYFNGVMDDVRLYDHGMSTQEVLAEFWRGGGPGVSVIQDGGFESGSFSSDGHDGWRDLVAAGSPTFSSGQVHSGAQSMLLYGGDGNQDVVRQYFDRTHTAADRAPFAVDWYFYPTGANRSLDVVVGGGSGYDTGPMVGFGAGGYDGHAVYYDGSAWRKMGYLPGNDDITLTPDAWYHARIVVDAASSNYDLLLSGPGGEAFLYAATGLPFRVDGLTEFRGVDFGGKMSGSSAVYVDDVRCYVVPEPGTLLLAGSGLVALARRRRRTA